MCLEFLTHIQFSHRSQLVSIVAKKVNPSNQTRVTTEAGDGGCKVITTPQPWLVAMLMGISDIFCLSRGDILNKQMKDEFTG